MLVKVKLVFTEKQEFEHRDESNLTSSHAIYGDSGTLCRELCQHTYNAIVCQLSEVFERQFDRRNQTGSSGEMRVWLSG